MSFRKINLFAVFLLLAASASAVSINPNLAVYKDLTNLLGDPNFDTALIDLDGDGYKELTGIDTNGDSIINLFMKDEDKQGGPELVYINTDLDEDIEVITLDANQDGFPDAWDMNGDETWDIFDLNGDFVPDAIDDDGDGSIDRIDADGDYMYDTSLMEASGSGFWLGFFIVLFAAAGYFTYKKMKKKKPTK